ncbi:MAG: hypothetical protein IKU36_13175 [Bacteroidales bacterium]|nr:hypothetical protein [Bacteroidales bacterium]
MYPNLNAEIARAGLSKKRLGELIGMQPTTLLNKLAGKTNFYITEAYDIKDVLEKELHTEVTLDYLFRRY